jgi:hypothetical protein
MRYVFEGNPSMHEMPRTVLLLEPDAARASRIRLALAGGPGTPCPNVAWAATLPDALQCLGRFDIDVVLFGIELCRKEGMDMLSRIRGVKPHVMVLLMSEPCDEPVPEAVGCSGAAEARPDAHPGPGDDTESDLSGASSLLQALRRSFEAKQPQCQSPGEMSTA